MINKILEVLYGEETVSKVKGAVDASQESIKHPQAYVQGYGEQMDANIKRNGGKGSWIDRKDY